MKAKEYYRQLCECTEHEQVESLVVKLLQDLSNDAEDLIKRRNARSREAVASCIKEVNQKYVAIVNMHDRAKDDPNNETIISYYNLDKDGFKAAFVHFNPQFSYVFDLESHKKKMDKAQERADRLYFHKVTPFEELTLEDLPKEYLSCLASLGSFGESFGLQRTAAWAKPLINTIAVLRYWYDNQKIDLKDVEGFDDADAWAESHKDILLRN